MDLAPLPLVVPLVAAALLLGAERLLRGHLADAIAVLVAIAVAALAIILARETWDAPIVYWFGGWRPVGGVPIGIAFVADPLGAGVTAFAAVLFAGTFVFAWGFFEDAGVRFHVLMLVFLAAIAGFCLTGDLFNFFVFFELMSVAAFALTAYKLEASSLEGALNFTVVNTIGSFLMLGGIGLLYAQTGALDFAAIGRALAGGEGGATTAAACVLIFSALLIKAAVVPFQFWLADAHAVAPSPVCVIFSGIMVSVALFGAARLGWTVFAPVAGFAPVAKSFLLYLGVAGVVLGGLICVTQRHVKRMLAFSTISHVGVMLVGLAVLTDRGLAGMLLYLVGHGFVKGALFMGAGILMSECRNIDEIALRGRARHLPLTGAAFAAGGLLLAGLPLGAVHEGHHLIALAVEPGHRWISWVLALGAALTGAAVLRAAGRIFLGLGPVPGGEEDAPSRPEVEKAGRPIWLMLTPLLAFIAAAVLLQGHPVTDAALHQARAFTGTGAAAGGTAIPSPLLPWASVLLAAAIAGWQLCRDRLPDLANRVTGRLAKPLLLGLDRLHSGRIGDYTAWMTAGLALFGAAFALG